MPPSERNVPVGAKRGAAPHDVRFRTLDLNLLRVFATLLEERNTTRAGERLGLTQSAISHALGRLRHVLHDPLFERGAAGLQPTPRAAEIAPRLRVALLQLEAALTPAQFEPRLTDRRFVVAMPAGPAGLLLPRLMKRLGAEAPRASVAVHSPGMALGEDLDVGRVDLAVGLFRRVPEHFVRETLYRDTWVWVLREGHPLARTRKPTLAQFAKQPHLVLGVAAEEVHAVGGFVERHGLEQLVTLHHIPRLEAAFGERGLERQVNLIVPYSLAAPGILAQSDMVALMLRHHALAIAKPFRLKVLEPSYAMPAVEMEVLWRRGHGDQPAVRWFRGLLNKACAEP